MDDQVRAALALLDPDDDGHWTSQGKPRMEIVSDLADVEVTRKQLDSVAPDFDRDAARAERANTVTFQATTGERVFVGQDDGPEGYDRRIEALRAEIAESDRQMRELGQARRRLEKEQDRLIAERDRAFPPLSDSEHYQQHLARHKEYKLRRVAKQREMEALRGPDARTPLDRAMASRRAWGQSRPNYRGQS